jgi:hypothetical protein
MPSTASTNRYRNDTWLIGRNDLAGDLRRQRRGLAQHTGYEMNAEPRPGRRRSGFLQHQFDEIGGAAFQRVRRLQQQRTTRARSGFRPRNESFRCRRSDRLNIGEAGRCRPGHPFARHRIVTFECPATVGADRIAVDDEIDVHLNSLALRPARPALEPAGPLG